MPNGSWEANLIPQKCLPVCKPYNLKLLDNAVFVFPHDCLSLIFKTQFYSKRRGSLSRLTVVLKSSCDFFWVLIISGDVSAKFNLNKCCQVFNLTWAMLGPRICCLCFLIKCYLRVFLHCVVVMHRNTDACLTLAVIIGRQLVTVSGLLTTSFFLGKLKIIIFIKIFCYRFSKNTHVFLSHQFPVCDNSTDRNWSVIKFNFKI